MHAPKRPADTPILKREAASFARGAAITAPALGAPACSIDRSDPCAAGPGAGDFICHQRIPGSRAISGKTGYFFGSATHVPDFESGLFSCRQNPWDNPGSRRKADVKYDGSGPARAHPLRRKSLELMQSQVARLRLQGQVGPQCDLKSSLRMISEVSAACRRHRRRRHRHGRCPRVNASPSGWNWMQRTRAKALRWIVTKMTVTT